MALQYARCCPAHLSTFGGSDWCGLRQGGACTWRWDRRSLWGGARGGGTDRSQRCGHIEVASAGHPVGQGGNRVQAGEDGVPVGQRQAVVQSPTGLIAALCKTSAGIEPLTRQTCSLRASLDLGVVRPGPGGEQQRRSAGDNGGGHGSACSWAKWNNPMPSHHCSSCCAVIAICCPSSASCAANWSGIKRQGNGMLHHDATHR